MKTSDGFRCPMVRDLNLEEKEYTRARCIWSFRDHCGERYLIISDYEFHTLQALIFSLLVMDFLQI